MDGGKAALVELGGILDAKTSIEFEQSLDQLRERSVHRVVVDFANIRYVNSTGLGMLVKLADVLRSAGGGMALVRVPSKVQIIMEMSGLSQVLHMSDDPQAALESLGSAAPPAAAPESVITHSGRWRSGASRLAAEEPERAMRRCRAALERAIPKLCRTTLGDPGNMDMNQMLAQLKDRGIMPAKVAALVYMVWELTVPDGPAIYQAEDALRRESYIAVASMTVLQCWFRQAHPGSWT